MFRRYRISKTIVAEPIIRNINTILNKMESSLMDRIDNDGEITINIYKIGKNKVADNNIIFSGTIQECLEWCITQQNYMKKTFDSFITNVKNNSDRKTIINYVKKLRDDINSTGLYDDKCFTILDKFVKQMSITDKKTKLPDSAMHGMIFGSDGIKSVIDFYRKIVTADRVIVLKSLKNYYINNVNKVKYGIGIKTIKEAIDNNETLKINTNNYGTILVKPVEVRKEAWSMLCERIDENGKIVDKIIVCQSDLKK